MELNQVQTDVTAVFSDAEGENLFEDSIDTPVEETETKEEPMVEETVTEEAVKEAEVEKPFLEVQYNKELKGLTQEEAKTLAQKGMNYDKMYDKYNTLEQGLEKLAKANGMSVDDYLVKLQEVQKNVEVENELAKLKEKYPDTNEEALGELARQIVANNTNSIVQSQIKAQQEQDDARAKEVERQIDEFKSIYPDLDPNTIPEEVIEMARDGKTLLGAYTLWNKTNEAKNSEAKIAKLNEENKKKSLGNTTNVGGDEPDDFFSGFDSI